MYCICSCNKSSPTGTTWEPDSGLDFLLLLMHISFCGCAGTIGLHFRLLLLLVLGTLGGCVGATSSAYRSKMHACLAMHVFRFMHDMRLLNVPVFACQIIFTHMASSCMCINLEYIATYQLSLVLEATAVSQSKFDTKFTAAQS